jgi:hypothetical protein
LTRNLTPTRLALARIAHQRALASALVIGLGAALALGSAVPLLQAVAGEVALRSTLDTLGGKQFLTVEDFNVRDPSAFDAFQSDAQQHVSASLGSLVAPGAQWSALGPVTPATINGVSIHFDVGEVLPTAAHYRDLAGHVQVIAGRMPADRASSSGDLPAGIPEFLSKQMGLKVGDQLCFPGIPRGNLLRPGQPFLPSQVCLRVSAVWKASRPGEGYWAGAPPGQILAMSLDDFYSFVQGYFGRSNTDTGHYFFPDLSRIDTQNAASVAARVNRLRGYFQVRREGLFSSGLDSSIRALATRQQTAAVTIQLVASGLIVIALFAVAFAATHYLDGQTRELSLLRARGWPRIRVWRLLVIQFALLAVVAVPAGLVAAGLAVAVASATVFAGSRRGLATDELVAVAPALGLVLAAGLVVLGVAAARASRRDVLEVRRSASRPVSTPWWRWANLDLLGVPLAIVLLGESRLRGGGQVRDVSASDDPLSLLLPSIAFVLLALASLRLLPLVAALARRLARGVPGSLAVWQLTRQPAQHARLALLLTLTVSVGVFSSVYASTEHRNTVDRAGYQAGAEVRATYQLAQEPPPLGQVLGSLPGVRSSSIALRTSGNPGRSDLQAVLMGVDPAGFPAVAWSRPDLNGQPLSQMFRGLAARDPDGLPLPGRPTSISVWVYSSGLDTQLAATLTDGDGRTIRTMIGSLAYTGWRQLHAAWSFPRGDGAYPVRLRNLVVLQHVGDRDSGQIAVSDLGSEAGVAETFDRSGGWFQATAGTNPAPASLGPSDQHPREDGRATTTVDVEASLGDLSLWPKPSDKPLPTLIASQTLGKLGIGLNESFPLHMDIHGTTVSAIGTLDHFPTLYPGDDDFMLVPLTSLIGRIAEAGGGLWPNELWLALGGPPAPVVDRLWRSPGILDVTDRASLEAAALTMAVIGFALHFVGAARGRLSEYAILQANGLSPGLVRRSLAIEEGVLLLHSLVCGVLLGVVFSYAVLPAMHVGDASTDLVPPTLVTVDPPAVGAALLVVVAGAALVSVLVGRAAARFDLLGQLREIG